MINGMCPLFVIVAVLLGYANGAFSQENVRLGGESPRISTLIKDLEASAELIDPVTGQDAFSSGLDSSLSVNLRIRMLTRSAALNSISDIGVSGILGAVRSKNIDVAVRKAVVVVAWAGLTNKSTMADSIAVLFKIADSKDIDSEVRQTAITGILLSGQSPNAVRRRLESLLEEPAPESLIAINSMSYAIYDNAMSSDEAVQVILSVIPRIQSAAIRTKSLDLVHDCLSLSDDNLNLQGGGQAISRQTRIDIDDFCKRIMTDPRLPTAMRGEIFSICDPTRMCSDTDVMQAAERIAGDTGECEYARKLSRYILNAFKDSPASRSGGTPE